MKNSNPNSVQTAISIIVVIIIFFIPLRLAPKGNASPCLFTQVKPSWAGLTSVG